MLSHIWIGFQESDSGLVHGASCLSISSAASPVLCVTTTSGAENGSSPEFAHKVKKAIKASVGINGMLTVPGRIRASAITSSHVLGTGHFRLSRRSGRYAAT